MHCKSKGVVPLSLRAACTVVYRWRAAWLGGRKKEKVHLVARRNRKEAPSYSCTKYLTSRCAGGAADSHHFSLGDACSKHRAKERDQPNNGAGYTCEDHSPKGKDLHYDRYTDNNLINEAKHKSNKLVAYWHSPLNSNLRPRK